MKCLELEKKKREREVNYPCIRLKSDEYRSISGDNSKDLNFKS